MAKLKRTFVAGIMNKDLDERLIPANQFRDALNVSIGVSDDSGVGAVENTKGNKKVSTISLPATAVCIGAVTNPEEFKIYCFVYDSTATYIYEYDELNNATAKILEDTRTGTSRVLDFNPDNLITGVNYYDGYLYWTDDYDPPRKIHVGNAKTKTQTSGANWFNEDDLNVIVKPPIHAPTMVLFNSTDGENHLEERFIYFAYRFKYEDDNYSALSPFSVAGFMPGDFLFDYVEHINDAMVNQYDRIQVSFDTGTSLVEEIQIVFKDSRSSNIYVIENLNKDELGYSDSDNETVWFDNSKIYSVLEESQLYRLFDNVPLKAQAQDIAGRRLVYGNYTQFRDISRNGSPIFVNIGVSYVADTAVSVTNPMRTFRSDRDYDIGMAYLDEYGRMSTVLTPTRSSNLTSPGTVYIPPTASVTANDIKVEINHLAPDWATHYRMFIKQKSGDYYNIFPMYFFQDGTYRWFRISEADRDKFSLGDYVICKSSELGATKSNTQYKILEIKVQDKDFLGNDEPTGLYFKIGVDGGEFNEKDLTNISSVSKGSLANNRKKGQRHKAFGDALIQNHYQNIELPIKYLRNPNNLATVSIIDPSTLPYHNTFTRDKRIYIQITDTDKFKAYDILGASLKIDGSPGEATITAGGHTIDGMGAYKVNFGSLTGYSTGDRFVFNVRAKLAVDNETVGGAPMGNIIEGWLNPPIGAQTFVNVGGWAIFPDWQWGLNAAGNSYNGKTGVDREIQPGATIRIKIYENNPLNDPIDSGTQEFSSSRRYDNLEEWFYEDGIYKEFVQYDRNGDDQGYKNVLFRRCYDWRLTKIQGRDITSVITSDATATNSVRMIIQGMGSPSKWGSKRNLIDVDFEIVQSEQPIIFETTTEDSDADIFHELRGTYAITADGYHYTNNINQSLGVAGEFRLNNHIQSSSNWQNNNFNAYCWGNGLETNRIKDDFNEDVLQYSPRVSTVIDDYKQAQKKDSICWSAPTSRLVNRFNEFNLSTANFKDLDISFGSIQKLFARDTNLLIFQEDKISYVPWNKNILTTASGSLNVTQSNEVAGTQVSYAGEYGISLNPESFAEWGNIIYFADTRRGAVLKLGGNGLFEISSLGMRDFFKDTFIAEPRNTNLGSIDPYSAKYVLAHTSNTIPCDFSLNLYSNGNTIEKSNASQNFDINITAGVGWAVTKVDTGDGTGWATISPATGSGSGGTNIALVSNIGPSSSVRSMTVRFTACGVNTDITLTQQAIEIISRELVTISNPKNGGLYNLPEYDYTTNPGSGIIQPGYIPANGTLQGITERTNYPTLEGIPTPGDMVTLKAPNDTNAGANKGFMPGLNNKMYYLVSNTEYDATEISSLVSAATPVTPIYNPSSEKYEGQFIYSRPSNEKYLYLLYDYTDNIPAGTTGTADAKTGTYGVNVDYGSNVGTASLSYDANNTPNRFVLKYNDVVVHDTGYVGLNSTANYNALIAAGVPDSEINLASPYTGTVNNGVGSFSFFKNSSSISNACLTVYSPLDPSDGWSALPTVPSLTAFTIFVTGRDNDSDVCSDTAVTTYYHSGSAAMPQAGDTIYTDAAGATALVGGSLYYATGSSGPSNTWVVISNSGAVSEVGSCACSEVAIPVIDTTTITIEEGVLINYDLTATNNPTSWGIVSSCKEYTLYGGTRGAVFSGTNCAVSEAKVVTVNGGETAIECFEDTSVSQLTGSSDATFTASGVCLDSVLPDGITFDNGNISGMAEESGEYQLRLTATNCFGVSIDTMVTISVNPDGLFKFLLDDNSPQDTSNAACALTGVYNFFFHNGDGSYPVLNNIVFSKLGPFSDTRSTEEPTSVESTDNPRYTPYNGEDKWYLMDNNKAIKIARDGRVIDIYNCLAGTSKTTEAGLTKTTEGASTKTLE
jgi:hypothetical protein